MDAKTGEFLVRAARKVMEGFVRDGKKEKPSRYPRSLDGKRGVFTTLHSHPGRSLRGCIGYPEPVMPLIDALVDSAVSVTRDPRFPPLSPGELKGVVVEVSVLTRPEPVEVRKPEEYPSRINLGKDGLIIESGFSRGLLLPQVPIEWGWDAEEFLSNLCMKAGLPPDEWLSGKARISKFHSEIFAEDSPGGKVVRKNEGCRR